MEAIPHLLPPDLPCRCSQCDEPLTLLRNYRTRYGFWARCIRSGAWIGGPIGLVLWVVLAAIFGGGRSVGFGIALCMILPAILCEGIVRLFCQKVRTLRCHRCEWEKDLSWVARGVDCA